MLTYTCYTDQHNCDGSVNEDVACACTCHVPKPKPRILMMFEDEAPQTFYTGELEIVLVVFNIINQPGNYDWDTRLITAAKLYTFDIHWAQSYAKALEAQVNLEKYQTENGEEFPDEI